MVGEEGLCKRERLLCDALASFNISLPCLLHDRFRQDGRRAIAIPSRAHEILTHELLVKGRLWPTWLPTIRRPKTGAIRRQYFIDENKVLVTTSPLQFRISDNDASRTSNLGSTLINMQRFVHQLRRQPLTDRIGHIIERDVLIMPLLCLCGGGIRAQGDDRIALAPWQFNSTNLPGGLIVLPTAPFEIASNNAFERYHLSFLNDHAPSRAIAQGRAV